MQRLLTGKLIDRGEKTNSLPGRYYNATERILNETDPNCAPAMNPFEDCNRKSSDCTDRSFRLDFKYKPIVRFKNELEIDINWFNTP